MEPFFVKKLDSGFGVWRANSDNYSRPDKIIAGLSHGADLLDWIADRVGLPFWGDDIWREGYDVALKRCGFKEDDKGNLIPLNEPEKPQSSIDADVAEFMQFLVGKGAQKAWVNVTYNDIVTGSRLSHGTTPPAIKRAKEVVPDLRVVRVMSGDNKGNHYTLNPELDEPKAVQGVKPDNVVSMRGDKQLPRNQELVLHFVEAVIAKHGNGVQIVKQIIANKTGVPSNMINGMLDRLSERGLLDVEYNGSIDPFCSLPPRSAVQ